MTYTIEDLGSVASGNAWMGMRVGRDPRSGAEVALLSMSKCGFLVLDPRTRKSTPVRSPAPESECWSIAQAPDGPVYAFLYGSGELLRWDWEGDEAKVVGRIPGAPCFAIDAAPDGRVYIPHAGTNHIHRYDPRTGKLEDCGDVSALGHHLRTLLCGLDGRIYLTISTYGKGTVLGTLDPATGKLDAVAPLNTGVLNWQFGGMTRDASGRILLPVPRYGKTVYFELVDGQARPVAPEILRPGLAFADGSYLDIAYREEIFDDNALATYVDAKGVAHKFEIERPEHPLRIFSVESGAGRIWCGTFIPLRLASYDPATGKKEHLGNPAHATGEIYNMAFSQGKLYMASYTSAPVTRYTPDKPWRKDDGIHANPAHLGYMKDQPRLHRPYGKAIDARGHVYFAARGDYGCFDSGISRVDPATDEMTRWIYPETTFSVMTYVKTLDQLLVPERRRGEKPLRFTFVSPHNGKVVSSEVGIDDDGDVVAWLDSGADIVYGLHAWRATLFAYSVSQRKVVASIREMRFGDHCHSSLMFGPDGRIWGLTNQAVWAADRELAKAEEVVGYRDVAYKNFYRFGMCTGPDGAVYFPNGHRLMRVRKT
ncbi:MAG: hypothetical protein NTW19_11360 [Planctomycetota bacterium]|nr:hypothetical protein [Planctomycetota bacterium]